MKPRKATGTRSTHRRLRSPAVGDALEIALGTASEELLTIRNALRSLVGVCPEHDDCHEVVGRALELAERAMLSAVSAVGYRADGSHEDPDAGRQASSLGHVSRKLQEALEVLHGGPEYRGHQQAFVLSAINYAATQVPPSREKLAREVVLYSVWRTTSAPIVLLNDPVAHDHAQLVITRWRAAGGRGRTRWQPAQEFLGRFGLEAKNARALKEAAEKYGIEYSLPTFEEGSRYVTMNEFDLITGRYTGCPCCEPEQFGLPREK